jgi:hypothetical protein
MLPVYESNGRIARQIDQYQFDLENQVRIEREILQAQESAPSMYSDKVSKRARDAWEERLWQNMEAHRHFHVRDQDEMVSDRPGRKLHSVQFVAMLNTLSRRRWILHPFAIRGMRGLRVSRGGAEPRYIMALDDGVMPEWSRLEVDDHGLVKKLAARGWRAVLLTLLDQSLVTEAEILKLFGFASGVSGALFRKYLFEHRNRTFADGERWKEMNRTRPNERYAQ